MKNIFSIDSSRQIKSKIIIEKDYFLYITKKLLGQTKKCTIFSLFLPALLVIMFGALYATKKTIVILHNGKDKKNVKGEAEVNTKFLQKHL